MEIGMDYILHSWLIAFYSNIGAYLRFNAVWMAC